MRVGVISCQMTLIQDFACKLRARSCEFPDQEKGRFHIVPGENFQQMLGVRIVRTVIVSERPVPRIASMTQR